MAEALIGLELHVRLATRTKLFCGCRVDPAAAPNTHVCPVCAGLPGALPAPNAAAVRQGLRLAAALGCTVAPDSSFARKQYLYPDLPRNYQITQQARPLARGGVLEFGDDLAPGRLTLQGIHLEEDAGRSRSVHDGRVSVDLNRAGAPLAEIVTAPELRTGEEAYQVLRALRRLLRWLDVSEARMEDGDLRCDANISLRGPDGAPGPRVELKNLNTARGVARALEFERARLHARLADGLASVPETRAWNAEARRTEPLRAKETAADYRFLEDPDLPPLTGLDAAAELARRALPELPGVRARRLARLHGLEPELLRAVTADRAACDRFEALARYAGDARAAARWCAGPVAALARERGAAVVPGAVRLARLLRLEAVGRVAPPQARALLPLLVDDPRDPLAVAAAHGLTVAVAGADLEALAAAVLAETPAQVSAYHGGKAALLGWFVGRVLARVDGRADPAAVRAAVTRILTRGGPPSP